MVAVSRREVLCTWAEALASKDSPRSCGKEILSALGEVDLAEGDAGATQGCPDNLLPICNFLHASLRTSGPAKTRQQTPELQEELVTCFKGLAEQGTGAAWSSLRTDADILLHLLSELMDARVLTPANAKAVSSTLADLLCSALSEGTDVNSSSDFVNLKGREALVQVFLQVCAEQPRVSAAAGVSAAGSSALPLQISDCLRVLQTAVHMLEELLVSSPVSKGALRKHNTRHQGLTLNLVDRVLKTVTAKDMKSAEEEWAQLVEQVLTLGQQSLQGALRSLSWEENETSESQAKQHAWSGASAVSAAPVVATAAVLLPKMSPTATPAVLTRVGEVHTQLTQLAESCLRAVRPIGVTCDTASQLLALATLCLLQSTHVVKTFIEAGGAVMDLAFSRLRDLVVTGAQLMQEAQVASSEWDWNLEAPCLVADYSGVYPTTELTRAAVQNLTDVLGVCWTCGHETIVKSLLLPGLDPKRPIGPESMPLSMMVGRLCVVVNGEKKLSRVVLPLLIDRLSSSNPETNSPRITLRLLHTLGKVAVAAAHNSDTWAFDQVVEFFIKLYKEPSNSISQHLMHSGSAPTGPNAAPRGSLALVMMKLASSLTGTPSEFAENLLSRFLSLFCDFGLKMLPPARQSNADTKFKVKAKLPWEMAADLVELLPVIAATCQQAQDQTGSSSFHNRMFSSRATFEELEADLQADRSRVKQWRILWLYCTLLGLTPLSVPVTWDQAPKHLAEKKASWTGALGLVGASSIPIIVEHSREEQEMLVDIRTRLARLGAPGEARHLLTTFAAVWRLPGSGVSAAPPAPPPERCAYLLAVAGLEHTRAAHSPVGHPRQGSHIAASFATLHKPGARDYAFHKALMGTVFERYLQRLRRAPTKPGGLALSVSPHVRIGREALAGVLLTNLHVSHGNPEVSKLAESLLLKLLETCTGLLFSQAVIGKLLSAYNSSEPPSLVVRVAKTWLSWASHRAPLATEAVLHEELRRCCLPGWQGCAGGLASLLLASTPAMPGRGQLTGLQALGRKLYFSGAVCGPQSTGTTGPEICIQASRMLEAACSGQELSPDLHDCCLRAAAVLVEHSGTRSSGEYFELLHLLVSVPQRSLDPATVQVVAFGLTWVSIGATEVAPNMLSEVSALWVSLCDRGVGLFAAGSLASTQEPTRELLSHIEAQQLLLGLLEEQWELTAVGAMQEADAVIMIFRRMVELSLHHPEQLLLHPCCAAVYFRLLTMSLKYCRKVSGVAAGKPSMELQVSVLFTRTLQAALRWFTMPPLYFQTGNNSRSRYSTNMAIDGFSRALKNLQPLPPVPSTAVSDVQAEGGGTWNAAEQQRDRVALQEMLLASESKRLQVWDSPLVPAPGKPSSASDQQGTAFGISRLLWTKYTITAWRFTPKLALALMVRFPGVAEVESKAAALVAANASDPLVQAVPEAAGLLARYCLGNEKRRPLLVNLADWAGADLVLALTLLNGKEGANIETRSYALRSLYACDPEEVAFYLPQLVQALRNDHDGDLKDYLKTAASKSHIFCHRLIWNLQSEEKPPPEAFDPEVKRSGWEPPKETGLWEVVEKVKVEVLKELTPKDLDYLDREFGFFDDVTKISGYLKKYDKAERPFKIGGYLEEVKMRGTDLYLPTNPDSRVLKLLTDSGTPMQSAAKVPILVAFEVESTNDAPGEAGKRHKQACIFKVGDDCRQDVMALQVIDLLKQTFSISGLDLYLVPYGVLPTGYECGIIEVVPNSASRASLGETSESGLYDIFQREFGAPGTPRFEEARINFIKSSAGYAVASFFLQAKDRHNGNILLDTRGNLVHIDFGFILEISPGNNMRFESAAFKLSHEMCQLLDPGGQRTSASFKMFESLCVKGYLAARTNVDAIMASVGLMANSGLPCFGRGEPVKNLYSRFHMEETDQQAAEFMRATIADAYDKWTTRFYDVIQWYQQGIEK